MYICTPSGTSRHAISNKKRITNTTFCVLAGLLRYTPSRAAATHRLTHHRIFKLSPDDSRRVGVLDGHKYSGRTRAAGFLK
jgi:hypothetical protein